jgi:hypothetical protein
VTQEQVLDAILLPAQARLPGRKYLDWHKASIFAA